MLCRAFVRLAAFRDSGYKILLQGGEIVNSDERVSEDYNRRLGDARMTGGSNRPGYIHERAIPQNLEGRAISALSCFGENAKMLSDQVWLNKLRHGSQTAGIVHFSKLYIGYRFQCMHTSLIHAGYSFFASLSCKADTFYSLVPEGALWSVIFVRRGAFYFETFDICLVH